MEGFFDMKKKFLLSLFILICFSCAEKNAVKPQNSNFVYPLEIGNKWEYNVTSIRYNRREEPYGQKDTTKYIEKYTSVLEIMPPDSLCDSLGLYLSVKKRIGSIWHPSEWHNYLKNNEDGLYQYFKANSYSPLQKNKINNMQSKMSIFNDGNLISNYKNSMLSSRVSSDFQRILKYPLEVGSTWDIIDEGFIDIAIFKNVISKQNITVPAGEYECYKIQTLNDYYSDGILDFGYVCYDYIHADGIIKTEIYMNGLTMQTIAGAPIVYYDLLKIYELTSVELK